MSLATGVGLVSGIDFNSIIAKLRQANSAPISQLARRGQEIQNRGKSLEAIKGVIADFKSAAEALTSRSSFLSLTGNSSNKTALSIGVSESAVEGSYSVKVMQLAQSGRIASQGVATLDSTPIASGNGAFSFRVGSGPVVSVDVTAATTLQDLADSINNLDSPGVRASIVNDGTATSPYRLVLTSKTTGAASKVSIATNGTSLNLSSNAIEAAASGTNNLFDGTATSSGTYTGDKTRNYVVEITNAGAVGAAQYRVSGDGGLTWSADNAYTTSTSATDISSGLGVSLAFAAGTANFAAGDRFTIDAFNPTLSEARDAVLEVDGIQVNRANNTFADVIEGVSLSALQVSDDPISVTVSSNPGAVRSKLNSFVSAYNTLVDAIAANTKYDVESQSAAPLFGDAGVNNVLATARSIVTGFVPGLTEKRALSEAGITVGAGGKLVVDSSKLDKALAENPDAIASLFVESGKSSSSSVRLLGTSAATKTGIYSINVTQAAKQAEFTASQALVGGLAASETVTVVYSENQTAIVNLNAGANINEVVQAINAALQAKSIPAAATSEGGVLKLNTSGYGSDQKFSIVSNRSAGDPGQLGIGTTLLAAAGKDVVATINGVVTSGEGRELVGGKGTSVEGLRLEISATAPMSAKLTVTRGVATQLEKQLGNLVDDTDGMFVTRAKSMADQIKQIEERIGLLQTRLDKQDAALRKRFNELEGKLSTMQAQGNQLLSQLSSMIN